MKVFPEHFLKLMKPEDRAALGPAGKTASEAQRTWQRGEEKKMHELFATDLQRRGIPFIHGRMDQKSTIRKGWPDFTVLYGGKCACVEFKAPGGNLEDAQRVVIGELLKAGVAVLVAYDVAAAIEFVRREVLNEATDIKTQRRGDAEGAEIL